jgi:ATP-dependent protease ClpP protease subunit
MRLVTILTSIMLLGCASLMWANTPRDVTVFEAKHRKVTNSKAAEATAPTDRPSMVELRDIDSAVVATAAEKLKKHADHGDKMLYLRINSNGGSVFAGLDFIQSVEELKKKGAKLTCIVDTRAISMGFVILQAVCDVRLATPRALFLAHNGSLRTDGGRVDDMEEDVALLSIINETMAEICSEKIGMTLEEYKHKLHDKKSWSFGSKEAMRENVVDRLISPMDTPQLDDE